MKNLVRRYVTAEQRNADETLITEDDVNEVKQDINSFKYELLNILRINGMMTGNAHHKEDSKCRRGALPKGKGRACERPLND